MTAQLRNPLHAIVGALTVIESGGLSAAEWTRELKSLRHGCDVMVGITSDVLDIQSISAGKLKLQAVWTNVRELLNE